MIVHLITKEFRSLGAFLEVLSHGQDFSVNDPRAPSHEHMVTSFLNGDSNIGMADIIDLIYDHPQSRPTNDNPEQDPPPLRFGNSHNQGELKSIERVKFDESGELEMRGNEFRTVNTETSPSVHAGGSDVAPEKLAVEQ
ncbi:hypothetical protein B0H10DRAFT_1940642 [Mycena sp. CBHHK59/15]|nr:hypothetical protein B0H10DRAFT_1940642 [Mycena sp. CBHHK59/15]